MATAAAPATNKFLIEMALPAAEPSPATTESRAALQQQKSCWKKCGDTYCK